MVAVLPVAVPAAGLTLIEVMALLGPLVIAPVGLALTRPELGAPYATVHRLAELAQPPAALAAVLSVLTPRGVGAAGLLAAVWLAVTVVAAVGPTVAWLRSPTVAPVPLSRAAAHAFLVVGAAWLVLDRAGWTVLGIAPTIVTLTAVHFHTAGFATSVIVHRTARWTGATAPRLTRATVWATVGGPLLIAVGFSALRPLLLAGAVVLTAGLYLLSWTLIRHVRPDERLARGLLVLAAVAIVIPMLLAVGWAAGEVLGTPALSVPDMARTHGLVNAFGFALPALFAWLVVDRPSG